MHSLRSDRLSSLISPFATPLLPLMHSVFHETQVAEGAALLLSRHRSYRIVVLSMKVTWLSMLPDHSVAKGQQFLLYML